ncbi:MAG: hypothetical protein WB757_13575, partial [Candidatus Cybelea sp.]
VITPFSVALDANANIYIVDQGKPNTKNCKSSQRPAILVFPPYNKKIPYTKPIRKIQGCDTTLNAPTDIKVNGDGVIYVADSTSSGSGIVLVFAAGAGAGGIYDVAPMATYRSPGAVTGLGLVP